MAGEYSYQRASVKKMLFAFVLLAVKCYGLPLSNSTAGQASADNLKIGVTERRQQISTSQTYQTFNYSMPDYIVPVADDAGDDLDNLDKRSHYLNKDDSWGETRIILVNATPYRWRRGYMHSWQLRDWKMEWPEYIDSGNVTRRAITKLHWFWESIGDSAGEVVYHLEGTSKPMSFTLRFVKGRPHKFEVQFMEELHTMNNTKGSLVTLPHHPYPGGSAFVLAGMESELISNSPPIGWMQALLPRIGHLPLREIVMPRSHHSGLWKITTSIGFGRSANTQTQWRDLDKQLMDAGVRVLDARPALNWNVWREGHGTEILGMWHGTLGAKYSDMIETINDFNDRYPGELIIWDIHGTDAWNGDQGFKPLGDKERQDLFDTFKDLKYRFPVPDDEDITKWPLERFIGNGRSAVLIRFDESWRRFPPSLEGFPGGMQGFVTNKNFPVNHYWSNRQDTDNMVEDQLSALHENRPGRRAQLYNADWVRSQKGAEAFFAFKSLLHMAMAPRQALFDELWNATTDMSYPNWIAIDGVDGSDFKSIVVAMNQCLAGRRCGSLGGKVKIWHRKPRPQSCRC